MKIDIQKCLNDLKKNGFARISGLFTPEQVKLLQEESSKLLDGKVYGYEEIDNHPTGTYRALPLIGDSDLTFRRFLGQSKRLDDLMEEFLSGSFKNILHPILGHGYKAWTFILRRAKKNGKGIGLHQDSPGETTVAILLNDDAQSGRTIFLPGSHLYPHHIERAGINGFPIKFVSKLLKPGSGKAGDVVIFFNKTWHGREDCMAETHSMIQIALLPSGYIVPTKKTSTEEDRIYFSKHLGKELYRLFDQTEGMQHSSDFPDGTAMVQSSQSQGNRLIDEVVIPKSYSLISIGSWYLFKLMGLTKPFFKRIRGIMLRRRAAVEIQ